VQLGNWGGVASGNAASELHRLPAAVGPTRFLGGNGRQQHCLGGARHGGQDAVPDAGWNGSERQRSAPFLRSALRNSAVCSDSVNRHPLLADSQRRRNLSWGIISGREREMGDPSDPKDFVAVVDSDVRKTPRRIAFITKRTSPQVHVKDEDRVMTYPEVFFRTAVAVQVLTIVLVIISLLWDAPLEGLADPMHTPNPAKAPWYFLGLQELLHYFPPVVAGVLIPGLVVMALIVIPYFNINVEAEPLWARNRTQRLRILLAVTVLFSVFLIYFQVYVALVPSLLMSGLMFFSGGNVPGLGRL